MTRLRVVVLDGVDWLWTSQNLDQLPYLYMMREFGCHGMLESTKVPVTTDAVAALLTGKEIRVPWVNNDRYSTSQELIRNKPWFRELKRYGMTLGLCNVPLTWPAFPLPKSFWLTSGFPVPPIAPTDATRHWKWPITLDVTDYPIGDVCDDNGVGGSKDLQNIMKYENEIVRWFMDTAPRADLEICWLRSTDSAGHHYWDQPEYGVVMQHADQMVSALSEGCDNLLVISDHGFDSVESDRCAAYMASDHGAPTRACGLLGGHSGEGVIFGGGSELYQGGLGPHKLINVASGIMDILGIEDVVGLDQSNKQGWVR